MGYPTVSVESPTFQGVRVDHDRLMDGMRALFKQGHSNEHVMRVIGLPQEVVSRARAKYDRERKEPR